MFYPSIYPIEIDSLKFYLQNHQTRETFNHFDDANKMKTA